MARIVKWFLIVTGFLLSTFLSAQAHANTTSAASCASTDVQAAINSASSGDTIVVPSGSCTWASAVNINNIAVTLQGQTTCTGTPVSSCTDNTSITLGVVPGGTTFSINGTSTNIVTLTGFTFIVACGTPNGCVAAGGDTISASFRIHHNHFIVAGTNGTATAIAAYEYGLIDHNLFDESGGSTNHMIDAHGDTGTAGFISWNTPSSLGAKGALFVEDNTINNSNQGDDTIDGYAGGRIVVRHNTINNASIGFHGTDSGSFRSMFSVEEYSNTFTNNSATEIRMLTLRGGTALIFSNTFAGSKGVWYGAALQNFRADGGGNTSSWQNCNGTNWKLGSTDPTTDAGRTNSTTGGVFWCNINRDTPATSNATCNAITPGDTATAYFDDNPGGAGPAGYACRDNPGRTHNQKLAPVYEWLNSPDYGIGTNDAPDHIAVNRDYYAYTTNFNGTSGVGSGLLSSRPATCTPNVAYWATDANTLYQCSSTSTWATYYAPYAYPHPLQQGGGVQTPAPPTNLKVVIQ